MSTVNRDAANILLTKIVKRGAEGSKLQPEADATMAVAYALLDVADAIREQTAALDLNSIRADLDDISAAARTRDAP